MNRVHDDQRKRVEQLPWPTKAQISDDTFEAFKTGMDCISEATQMLLQAAYQGVRCKDLVSGLSHDISGDIDSKPAVGDPLLVTSAGIPCIDHSAIGSRARFVGPRSTAATVFARERKARVHQEHFSFYECGPEWEPIALRAAWYPTTTVESIQAELHDFGFPVYRKRTLALGCNQALSEMVMGWEQFVSRLKAPRHMLGKICIVNIQQ